MGHFTCCIVNCGNTWRNSDCKFYYFPKRKYLLEQRNKWINAVRRINADGTAWTPRDRDVICNQHFIGQIKSNNPQNPSYVPTIFPSIYKRRNPNEGQVQKRFERTMNRRKKNSDNSSISSVPLILGEKSVLNDKIILDKRELDNEGLEVNVNRWNYMGSSVTDFTEMTELPDESINQNISSVDISRTISLTQEKALNEIDLQDKGYQVNIPDNYPDHNTSVCTSSVYLQPDRATTYSDASVQTDLIEIKQTVDAIVQTDVMIIDKRPVIYNKKKSCSIQCGPPSHSHADISVDTNDLKKNCEDKYFTGFASISTDEQMLDLVGVSLSNFKVLLERLPDSYHCTLSKENRLLLFLLKIKTGLSYSALSVIFRIDRRTVSRCFNTSLQHLGDIVIH